MGREAKKKIKRPNPKRVKKAIAKRRPGGGKSRRAAAEAAKVERRRERKGMLKVREKRKEAVEEEELKIEKELFDNQGYYPGPVAEEVELCSV